MIVVEWLFWFVVGGILAASALFLSAVAYVLSLGLVKAIRYAHQDLPKGRR